MDKKNAPRPGSNKCQNVSRNKITRITGIYTGNAEKPDRFIYPTYRTALHNEHNDNKTSRAGSTTIWWNPFS
jgi:hypothetical protein